jgi:hypothetical protein
MLWSSEKFAKWFSAATYAVYLHTVIIITVRDELKQVIYTLYGILPSTNLIGSRAILFELNANLGDDEILLKDFYNTI